jgi:plasmid stabilization system protein ParE
VTARVLFSSVAWSDLREIGRHIAKDNPGAGDRLLGRIEDVCQQLAGNPGMGEIQPDLGPGEYRSFTVWSTALMRRELPLGA